MIVVEQLADIVRQIPGIQAATDEPPGQIADDPIAIVYVNAWNIGADTAWNANGNITFAGPATIHIDIHVPRADIANAYRVLEPFTSDIPAAIYRALDPHNKDVTIAFRTAVTIAVSTVLGNYNGIDTIVRRIAVTGRIQVEAIR